MSTPSIAKSRNLKTAASKKRSVKSSATARRQVTSAATRAKALPKRRTKGRASYQAGAPADTAESSRGASIEEMTQATDWQQHSVRGFLAGGEEEAWFLADHFESGRRRRPLPHRDASRSLTWPSRRSISRSRWRGFPPRRSSNCTASGGGCIGRRRRCGCPVISCCAQSPTNSRGGRSAASPSRSSASWNARTSARRQATRRVR